MDINDIKTLISIASNAGIAKLSVTKGDCCVSIVCHADCGTPSTPNTPTTVTPPKPTSSTTATATAPQAPQIDGTLVHSPMLGTFYRKSSPDATEFVAVGSHVQAGDTLCIVEAMKIMHEVKAPATGVVASIVPEDGAMVEVGDLLLTIKAV